MPAEPKKNGAVDEIDLEEYQRLKRSDEELQRLKSNTVSAEDHKKLQEQLKAREEADRKRDIETCRAKYSGHIRAAATEMNRKKFNGALPQAAIEEIVVESANILTDEFVSSIIGDKVYGEEKAVNKINENLFGVMKKKAEILEQYDAAKRRSDIAYAMMSPVNLNTLSPERRALGGNGEQTYWSDEKRVGAGHSVREQMMNFVLTKALKKPIMKEDGRTSWLAEHRARLDLDRVIANQKRWEQSIGASEGHIFSPNGKLFGILAHEDVQNKLARMFLSEAGEMTTPNTVGTGVSNLALDATTAVIMGAWPRMIAKQIAARVGVMTKTTKRIREIGYPRDDTTTFREDKHFFGAVDSDNPTTLATTFTATTTGEVMNDEGALVRASGHIPQDLYAVVGEVVDATTTITVTGLNQNGDATATASVTIYTTDAVNTKRKFTPTFFGDTFLDVTAVTSSGWTDAAAKGEVGIFTQEPYSGHTAGAAAQKSRFVIRSSDVAEESYDLQSNLTLNLIEDLQMSLMSDGEDGIDAVAEMVQLLQIDLNNYIDRMVFDRALQNVYTGNQATFNANTPSGEYSDQKWKERLHFFQNDLLATVAINGGFMPNWIVWSLYDKAMFEEWLTSGGFLHRLSPEANDPFANGKAQFTIGGASVYVSENIGPENILTGNNINYGIHSYDYVLKMLQAPNPTAGFEQVIMIHYRGYNGVPSDNRIYGGRAIGKLKVNRR